MTVAAKLDFYVCALRSLQVRGGTRGGRVALLLVRKIEPDRIDSLACIISGASRTVMLGTKRHNVTCVVATVEFDVRTVNGRPSARLST